MKHLVPFVFLAAASLLVASAHAQTPTETITAPPDKNFAPKNRAPIDKNVLQVPFPTAQTFALPARGLGDAGARLFVVEDHHLPLITITVSVPAGTLVDDPAHPGVAGLTAALLTEGTTTRAYDQINLETARLGATLNADAGAERATVRVSGLAENADQLIDLLADALTHPTFPTDRLDRLRARQIAGRAAIASNPQFLSATLTREVLYGKNTPYGRPETSPAQLKAITADDLRAFYRAHYTNSPDTLIGVTGDVKAKDIAAKLQTALGMWRSGAMRNPSPVDATGVPGMFAPKDKTAVYIVDRPGSQQTYINFANLGISRTDPDFFPLQLANYILGGAFNSRLNADIREAKGYTYGVRSALTSPRYPGTWTMGGSVRNAVTAPAITAFYTQFDQMQAAPVTPEELAAAKRAIVGGFALTLENPSTVLDRIIEVTDYGLPADYWDTYPQKIQAVTADDVQRVTKKYLGTGKIQLIAVGERATIEPGVTAYGPVTVVTPAEVMGGK